MPKSKSTTSFRFHVSSFKTNGFTLVELILYVALVGILLTAGAIFASDVVYSSVKGRVRAKVQHEATFAMEKMRQEIVKGDNIIVPSRNNTIKIADVDGVWNISMVIGVDNLPIISQGNWTLKDLAITKCGNASCSSGNVTTKIPDVNDVGSYGTSIAIGADGFPVISYMDSTLTDLAITKCGNASCSSGNVTTKITDANNVGGYSSITIGADGLPVISYIDFTLTDLAITKCGNASCSSGNITTKISDANNVGSPTSIAIGTDGLPVISYGDFTLGDLAITKCGNASCSSGNVTTKITDANNVGGYSSIAIGVDGLPIISHGDFTLGDLAITKCGNASCSSGNVTTKISDANNVGSPTSIAIGVDGLPVISHVDFTLTDLAITKCGNASCSSGNVTTKISDSDNIGYSTSIAIGTDGLPIISYLNTPGLVITKCNDVSCLIGNANSFQIEIASGPPSLTCFQVSADKVLQVSYGGTVSPASCNTTWQDLTSPEVEVTNFVCQNISSGTSLGEEAVKIQMTLKNKNPGGKKEFDAEVNLETSISLRL